ncbi:MAG: glycosyltransferase family 4 protein [Deltaproteobacteria bacterium]|nr:glycosyltransferase family 4 protein [Deltaproteobacteria bacterium]
MRILFLHKYGRKAASFRYRIEQYLPYFERAGFECEVSSLLDEQYLDERFRTGRRAPLAIIRAAARRLRVLARVRDFDLVVIGVELFPYVPALFERAFAAAGVRFVYDYDDPIFHYYDLSQRAPVRWLLGGKIGAALKGAALVFAGSPYLVEYSRRFNPRVEYLPTVVDLAVYSRTRDFSRESGAPFTIGWIGSPSTGAYLAELAPVLRDFARGRSVRVVVVGAAAGDAKLAGLPVEYRPWSEEREVADLLGFDVGVMPLTDDAWSRGKCGFKLIQYMACGLPVVASPVGVNREIVVDEVNGFLASRPHEWARALERLYDDRQLRARMGAASRKRVEERYCLAVTAPKFIAGVEKVLGAAKA